MMDIQGLKDKILQLAIQGKLVEQDENDEPASVLLEKIREERDKLVKDKEIRKEKPLPEVTEEEKDFDIPKGWEWVRLGEALCIRRGASPRPIKKYITDNVNGVNWIKIGDATAGGKYITSVNQMITQEGARKSVYLKSGALIMSNSMSFGKAYILGIDGCIHDGWLSFEFNKDYLVAELLQFFLSASYSAFDKIAVGTGVRNLNINMVRTTMIPLPPLQEQKRIVKKIEQLFALIDELDSDRGDLLETINLTRNKVLQKAIQGKLVEQNKNDEPAIILLEKIKKEKEKLVNEKKIRKEKPLPKITEDEIPFEIPQGWTVVRYGDIAQYKKGPFGSNITKSMFVLKSENTAKVYEQKNAIQKNINIGDYYITAEKFKEMKSFELYAGDIIVSCAGTIGETFVMPANIERGIINQALMKITLSQYINKQFYLMYFDYILISQITDKSKGSAIKNIPPLKHLKNIVFPLPPLAEQKRIVEKADIILGMLDELEKGLINKI
ncbi:MAG TPA: hypothetical protein GX707_15025 [Epulopiscium sp.]|nr:hypothetical protein [Candidatus Epulonipiscium sp.]